MPSERSPVKQIDNPPNPALTLTRLRIRVSGAIFQDSTCANRLSGQRRLAGYANRSGGRLRRHRIGGVI